MGVITEARDALLRNEPFKLSVEIREGEVEELWLVVLPSERGILLALTGYGSHVWRSGEPLEPLTLSVAGWPILVAQETADLLRHITRKRQRKLIRL